MRNFIDTKTLDAIVKKTSSAIEDGKKEIFEISEQARQDYISYEQEWIDVKANLSLVINEVDKLDIRLKMARNMIKTINDHFDEFTEEDIKDAYSFSERALVELSVKRKEEKELSDRRNELERLMKNSLAVLKKSELLEMKVSVALEYLNSSVHEQIKDIKHKKDLGLRIIEAQENEKKRISRDIHDGPAQSLANVVLKAEYIKKIVDSSPEKAKREVTELQEGVRMTLKDIRKIIYDLMPMSLDDLGLISTVKKMVNTIEDTAGIAVQLSTMENATVSNPLINLMAFRVIQESLNNVLKHAQCKKLKIKISIEEENIMIQIEDDGVGFAVKDTLDQAGGYGLHNMKERIEIVSGFIEINSEEGKGTQLKFIIPNE
ncbi:histidine kinase [Fusibacter sp. JL298sf-3]